MDRIHRSTIALALLCACSTDIRDEEAAPSETMGPPSSTTGGSTTAPMEGRSSTSGETSDAQGESGTTGGWEEQTGSSTGDPEESGDEEIDWPVTPCADDNEDPWLLGLDGEDTVLVRYRPAQDTFEAPIPLACLDGATATGRVSLAVGRDGRAYATGLLPETLVSFSVFDEDPCADLETTPWTAPSQNVALAFRSIDLFEADTERLLVHGEAEDGPAWLGEVFAFAAGAPVAVLTHNTTDWSELAGTSDGRLFAVATSGNLWSITGDTFNGDLVSDALDLRHTEFFFWAGDLYVIIPTGGMNGATVSGDLVRLDLDGSDTTTVLANAGTLPLEVLSMATSTCAPLNDR